VFHEEVEEGDDGSHPRSHCRDVQAPVLLVFDEGFEIGAFYFRNVAFARCSIKLEKEHDRSERTFECSPFVIHPPLVAHVALDVLLGGKVQGMEPLKDTVYRGSFAYGFVACCAVAGLSVSPGSYLPPFLFRKSRLDDDPGAFGGQQILLRIGR